MAQSACGEHGANSTTHKEPTPETNDIVKEFVRPRVPHWLPPPTVSSAAPHTNNPSCTRQVAATRWQYMVYTILLNLLPPLYVLGPDEANA